MFLMPGMVIALHTCGMLDSVLRWAAQRGAAGAAAAGAAARLWGRRQAGALGLAWHMLASHPFPSAISLLSRSPQHQGEMIRYLGNHQNEDGGWVRGAGGRDA